ncbi:hypothetical protein SBF1_2680010 [Candidatus Desulfosporosinus infrequens]|uniref:Uncharacterized protein n=1 Tax=Candidatus Desulfosporosinus infrequens TaxID=2043169 RepID=A0A2U3KTD5_9FIRM|nr:hypothetical protein SBF1_2680010 [Candidatus Desulfosporosinus infrequens]
MLQYILGNHIQRILWYYDNSLHVKVIALYVWKGNNNWAKVDTKRDCPMLYRK